MSGFEDALRPAAGGNWPNTVMLAVEPGTDGAYKAALKIAAAILGGHQPDGCELCRRVLSGIHPDVRTLDRETAIIAVDDIRALRRDAYVAPLEASRKVYLIRHSQNMNIAAQNAALKILEEPPAGVYFILLCENTSAMLKTVMSRCMLLRDDGTEQNKTQRDEEAVRLASSFVHALATGEELTLFEFFMGCDKLKRAQLDEFFSAALDKLRSALLLTCGAGELCENSEDALALSAVPVRRLVAMTEIIKKRKRLNSGNVGAAHLLGTIPAEYFSLK